MSFCKNKIMLLWVKMGILTFLDLGLGEVNPVLTTKHVRASQKWFENKPKTLLWHSEANNQGQI